MATEGTHRFYRPSGRVEIARFVGCSALAVALALLLAAVMHVSFVNGQYFVFLLPLFLSILVAGIGKWTIVAGHCRSPLWGVALGLLLGSVMYLGYYHIGMVHESGVQYVHRLDLLPSYIEFRVTTDVMEDHSRPGAGSTGQNSGRQPDVFGWSRFWLEYSICLGFPVCFGFVRARRPYCERCGAWQTQRQAYFPEGIGPALVRFDSRAQPARSYGLV